MSGLVDPSDIYSGPGVSSRCDSARGSGASPAAPPTAALHQPSPGTASSVGWRGSEEDRPSRRRKAGASAAAVAGSFSLGERLRSLRLEASMNERRYSPGVISRQLFTRGKARARASHCRPADRAHTQSRMRTTKLYAPARKDGFTRPP